MNCKEWFVRDTHCLFSFNAVLNFEYWTSIWHIQSDLNAFQQEICNGTYRKSSSNVSDLLGLVSIVVCIVNSKCKLWMETVFIVYT